MDNGNGLSAQLYDLRKRVGELSARAVAGEDLLTGSITDASKNLNFAAADIRNREFESARELLQLASEQLDTAEQ